MRADEESAREPCSSHRTSIARYSPISLLHPKGGRRVITRVLDLNKAVSIAGVVVDEVQDGGLEAVLPLLLPIAPAVHGSVELIDDPFDVRHDDDALAVRYEVKSFDDALHRGEGGEEVSSELDLSIERSSVLFRLLTL